MTRGSVKEYLKVMQARYLKATRKEKSRLLDEFVQVTGYHRKAAIRLLRRRRQGTPANRVGRPKEYGLEVQADLKVAWEISDRMCYRRLLPFLPELTPIYFHEKCLGLVALMYLY